MMQPRCIFCLRIDSVCFFFGFVNCVLSVFGVVILTIALNFLGCTGLDEDEYWKGNACLINDATYAFVVFLYICCVSSIIFSILLCYGTYTRRSSLLKVYLKFGILLITLMILGAAAYFYLCLGDGIVFSFIFMACCIYSLPLFLVQRTYKQFRAEKNKYLEDLCEYVAQ